MANRSSAVVLMVIFVASVLVSVPIFDMIPSIEKRGGTKLVGLISHTHLPSRFKKLPDRVFNIFRDADLIIHAGDITRMEVVKELEKLAPVMAVHGNVDPHEVRVQLPAFNSAELLGRRIGVTHDPGAIWGMDEMKRLAKEEGLNVLIFGHTHRQSVKWRDSVLFVNPGAPQTLYRFCS